MSDGVTKVHEEFERRVLQLGQDVEYSLELLNLSLSIQVAAAVEPTAIQTLLARIKALAEEAARKASAKK